MPDQSLLSPLQNDLMETMTIAWDSAKESRLQDETSCLRAAEGSLDALVRGGHWPDTYWIEYILVVGANTCGSAVLNRNQSSEYGHIVIPLFEEMRRRGWLEGGPTGYFDAREADGLSRAARACQPRGLSAISLFDVSNAIQNFEQRIQQPLDTARQNALSALAATITSPVAMITVFRRYIDTGLPPDGGRGQAVPVLVAATPEGVVWAAAPESPGGVGDAPSIGCDRFRDYASVTFNMAEMSLEGGSHGTVGFGTERSVSTSEGEYMRALIFTIACAELGYGGEAQASAPVPPDEIAKSRAFLGLPSLQG
jgi:hypothetical protein